MKVEEITIATKEFMEFVNNIFPEVKESNIAVIGCDLTSCEIKFKYEDEAIMPGVHVTSYKINGSWGDIKVHIKPRAIECYNLKKA